MNALWVRVAVPSIVVCVPVALVALSVSSPILMDEAATRGVVVVRGTCFRTSFAVCSFLFNNLQVRAKTSSGRLSMVTCGMFFKGSYLVELSPQFIDFLP